MFWHLIHFLTYFGDSMLLVPTALVIALLLLWKRNDKRSACYWVLAFCATGAIVSLSKIAFMGFGIGSARFNFTGFSGHSAMSATLWPVMLWLLSGRLSAQWRNVTVIIGYFIPLCVGISRLVLHYHSNSEVIAGLLLGYTPGTLFLISQRHLHPPVFSSRQLGIIFLIPVLLIGQGRIATTQQFLQQLSAKIAGIEHAWTREQLLQLRQSPHTLLNQ